jgi:hypothetical protein
MDIQGTRRIDAMARHPVLPHHNMIHLPPTAISTLERPAPSAGMKDSNSFISAMFPGMRVKTRYATSAQYSNQAFGYHTESSTSKAHHALSVEPNSISCIA